MWIYAASAMVTFCAVFLKGFQHKNVIGGHMKSVFVTSYLMAAVDVLAVAIVIQGGIWTAISSGTGAALGMVSAIKLHNRLFKEK